MISPMIAAKAYAAAQGQTGFGDPTAGAGAAAGAPGQSFQELLAGAMNDTVQQTKAAESQMIAGVQGKADLVDVVTSISSAQQSLETVMAVRDQVISAYQEIMRMPI